MRRFKVVLEPDALADLVGMREHIAAARGATFAGDFIGRIFDHLAGFQTAALRGTRRDDIRPGLRLAGWRRTLTIAFAVREESETVVILAILYRGRDVEAVLEGRGG